MPEDPRFPANAEDWLTGEFSPDVVYREGKWWTTSHWKFWGRDHARDVQRYARNRALSAFLSGQPADPGL